MSETLGQNAVEDIEAAAYLGVTLIAGEEVHHLAFSELNEDWQIWISTNDEAPVPIMIIGTDPYRQGWPQYRAHLQNWSFEVTPPEAGFSHTPHDQDVAVTMPALVPTERERAIDGASGGTGGATCGSTGSND